MTGRVAQLVEQLTFNQLVVGSIPTAVTTPFITKIGLAECIQFMYCKACGVIIDMLDGPRILKDALQNIMPARLNRIEPIDHSRFFTPKTLLDILKHAGEKNISSLLRAEDSLNNNSILRLADASRTGPSDRTSSLVGRATAACSAKAEPHQLRRVKRR